MYDQQARTKTRPRGFKVIKWILSLMVCIRGFLSLLKPYIYDDDNLVIHTGISLINVEVSDNLEWFLAFLYGGILAIGWRLERLFAVLMTLIFLGSFYVSSIEDINRSVNIFTVFYLVLDTTLIGLTGLIGYRIKTDGRPSCNCWCCIHEGLLSSDF